MAINKGIRQLYFGASNGRTYNVKEGTYTDMDGTPIAVRIRTKDYYLDEPDGLDEIQRVFAFADEPFGTNLSISVNQGDYEYLGSVQEMVHKFDIWKDCYRFSMGLDEISDDNIKIKGFSIIYEPRPEVL